MELSCLKKLFILTLDKTPLGETGCLSNLYYLLAAYKNCSPKNRFQKIILKNCSLKIIHFKKIFIYQETELFCLKFKKRFTF